MNTEFALSFVFKNMFLILDIHSNCYGMNIFLEHSYDWANTRFSVVAYGEYVRSLNQNKLVSESILDL